MLFLYLKKVDIILTKSIELYFLILRKTPVFAIKIYTQEKVWRKIRQCP